MELLLRLRDLPIKRKVTLVILFTCTSVLLFSGAIMAGFQIYDYRRTMENDTVAVAAVLASSSQGALAFQDEVAARERLAALQAKPSVVAASVYAKDGTLIASYVRQGETFQFPSKPPESSRRYEFGFLAVTAPVMLNDKPIGTLYLRTDMRGMYDRFYLFGIMGLLVVAGSCLVAYAISTPLQRTISDPILSLTEGVRQVSRQKDYSVRLPAGGKEEIGELTSAFNQFLAGIQERDDALRAANDSLRQEVNERKSAEDRVQAQLARLQLLQRITRAIGERLDLASIFQVVVRTVEDQLPAGFCAICMREAGQESLRVASVGINCDYQALGFDTANKSHLELDQNGLERCLGGRLIYEPDVSAAAYPFSKRLAATGLNAFVAAPLLVESQVFGLLLVARVEKESFSSGECEFLRQLSEHVGLAAHQAQLHTALQQAYNDLRQSQQAVMQQERLRALGQMASGIAHDINNAISPVTLYTESLLETEANLSERARGYLQTIQSSIEDVAQTVLRMREFYRQREPQLTLLPVEVNRLIQQVLDLSRARWSDMPQQRGVVVEMATELEPNLPLIKGVESEIREALLNLVFNAVDAMPDGGKITVRTKLFQNGQIMDGEKSIAVEVSDTGIGMDEDTRRRCLEPFFTTKGERGTGLGLAMVYGIAQRHGAEIAIESAPGQGTTMRLIFAAAPPAANTNAVAPAARPMPHARLRILIVDDDPLLIKSLRDTLETDGHTVVAANGGQAGIDAFAAAQKQSEPFSVVITDLGMPYVDGRKVAAAIKGMSPSTPILLLTGWGERLVAEGNIPPHVDKVLNKPPKLRSLREALATFGT